MALGRRKRFQRPGLPEAVGVALLGLAVTCAALWWRGRDRIEWRRTAGEVVRCEFRRVHYNAPDSPYRVEIAYAYSLNGVRYTGEWSGYWPQIESPNALPEHRVRELEEEGYPLVVFYDPSDASRSRLHDAPRGRRSAYASVAVGGLALAFA